MNCCGSAVWWLLCYRNVMCKTNSPMQTSAIIIHGQSSLWVQSVQTGYKLKGLVGLTDCWKPIAGTLHLTAASSSWLQPRASLLKKHSVTDFSNPEHATSFMWTGPMPEIHTAEKLLSNRFPLKPRAEDRCQRGIGLRSWVWFWNNGQVKAKNINSNGLTCVLA